MSIQARKSLKSTAIAKKRSWGIGPRRRNRAYMIQNKGRKDYALLLAKRALYKQRKMDKQRERKYLSVNTGSIQIPIAGNWILSCFGPFCQQGTTNITRIGNDTTVQSLAMRILIKLSAIEALGTTVRLVIFIDRKPAGAVPTSTMVMATDNQLNSGYNLTKGYVGRFRIIFDQTFSFGVDETMKAIKFYYQQPTHIEYTGDAGTIADLRKNSFSIMAMAEDNAAAINVDYGYSFRFTDE